MSIPNIIKNRSWFIFLVDLINTNKEFFRRYWQNKLFNEIARNSNKISESTEEPQFTSEIKKGKLPQTTRTQKVKIENNLCEFEYKRRENKIYIPSQEKKIKRAKSKIEKPQKLAKKVKLTPRNIEKEFFKVD